MNGIPVFRILVDQFTSSAPTEIERSGIRIHQILWLVLGAIVGVAYSIWGDTKNALAAILAANTIFTALSLTMAMFFWPRAINLKNDPDFLASDSRWHVYKLTTQLFWTVFVGIVSTGVALVDLGLSSIGTSIVVDVGMSVCVGLTAYQVLLLGQSVVSLYAATYWMAKA